MGRQVCTSFCCAFFCMGEVIFDCLINSQFKYTVFDYLIYSQFKFIVFDDLINNQNLAHHF